MKNINAETIITVASLKEAGFSSFRMVNSGNQGFHKNGVDVCINGLGKCSICTEVNGELLIGNEYFDTIEQLEREIDRIKSGRKHDE